VEVDDFFEGFITENDPIQRKDAGKKKSHKISHKRNRNWPFIAWDGEGTKVDEPTMHETVWGTFYHWPDRRNGGAIFKDWVHEPQPYVLLAHSIPNHPKEAVHIAAPPKDGLSTHDCFEFMLNTKQHYPDSIFVGFAFNYDVNQILKDLTEKELWDLHNNTKTNHGGYFIQWMPHKSFNVVHHRTKRSFILYDVFGFFQTSFIEACKEYLGEDDPDLGIIEEGKAARNQFTWEELDDFIIPYNRMELDMLVRMMDLLRNDFHAVGIHPGRWHGPGAVANETLKKYGVPIQRDIPKEVNDAAQYAYAGGRFEQFYVGRYPHTVWEYDIRSAYPAAATRLPDLSGGTWENVQQFEPGSFGVWNVDYRWNGGLGRTNRPQPLFCRAEHGTISYPNEVSGWYWTPEASLVADHVIGGYVYRPSTDGRPFGFIEDLYEQRRALKSQNNPAQRALKLILNSLYGKTAQTVGGKKGPPAWHQLEFAGYITSYTRAKIHEAILLNPEAIIATETDAVFSTVPLDLPLSTGLGDWEEKEYKSIVYLQSGFYYAELTKPNKNGKTIICKYRGMDRDRNTGFPVGLPYRDVLDHLDKKTGIPGQPTPNLFTTTTRFIGLGLGLRTSSVWRSWERNERVVSLDQRGRFNKRAHLSEDCPLCQAGISMYQQLHPMKISGYSGPSYARKLPWKTLEQQAPVSPEEYGEINDDWQAFCNDMDRFQ